MLFSTFSATSKSYTLKHSTAGEGGILTEQLIGRASSCTVLATREVAATISIRHLGYAIQVYNTTQASTCIHTGLRINPLIPELFADPFLLG